MNLKNRARQKGLTLLELLVSIMLFCIVMVAFAMVFPGGFRLNLKNRNESKASMIANGIINKLQNIRFLEIDPNNPSITEPSIENLQTWQQGTFADIFENDIPEPFYLPYDELDADGNTLKGIDVQILDTTLDGRGSLAKITVTVAWKESTRAQVMTKYVSITTYRSRNHQ